MRGFSKLLLEYSILMLHLFSPLAQTPIALLDSAGKKAVELPKVEDLSVDRLQSSLDKAAEWGISIGGKILLAAIIYVVGRFLIQLLNKLVGRVLSRQRIDPGVQTFLRSLVNVTLTVLLLLTVVGTLGVNTTSFAALLASAGVAIGMALSGNLQNFAGGLVILFFKPYRVGDWIEAQDVQGEVKEIQIFHTVVTTADNRVVYMPNGGMSTAVVVNHSRNALRRYEVEVGIGYNVDVKRAMSVIEQTLKADSRILSAPAPYMFVSALADSSVNIKVRMWVKNEDYWPITYYTLGRIYDAFVANDIEVPFPQRVVHFAPGNGGPECSNAAENEKKNA